MSVTTKLVGDCSATGTLAGLPNQHFINGAWAAPKKGTQAVSPNVDSLVLELGGKSPLIVLGDADLDQAVEGVIGAVPAMDAIVQEEIFGPVLAVQVADDEDHALELANGTDFGLVAGIYTRDLDAVHRMARDIDAGQIHITGFFAGGIELPFGGNRKSGFEREKGLVALQGYTRVKSVAARIAPRG